jgi:hypothetical protein
MDTSNGNQPTGDQTSANQPTKEGGVAPEKPKVFNPISTTVDEFENPANRELQEDIFAKAISLRDRQQALGDKILADAKITDGKVKAVLKRNTVEEFVSAVVTKCLKYEWTSISQMDDMVRGRFDLASWEDVEAVKDALKTQTEFPLHKPVTDPRRRVTVDGKDIGFGYPRYHIILEDPATGLTYEWQVGTEVTTKIFENTGIELHGLELKPGMKANIHDIEYVIFKGIYDLGEKGNQEMKELAERTGVKAFRDKFDIFAAESGSMGNKLPNWQERLKEMHAEASEVLKKLINEKGYDFIKSFYH